MSAEPLDLGVERNQVPLMRVAFFLLVVPRIKKVNSNSNRNSKIVIVIVNRNSTSNSK